MYDKLDAYYEKIEEEVWIMERIIFKGYELEIQDEWMDIIKVKPYVLQPLLDKATVFFANLQQAEEGEEEEQEEEEKQEEGEQPEEGEQEGEQEED